ncbi:hypothetical protein MIMGU_mgv1a005514mg [Erythranthe guttata]|uniref:TPX2 C-terminal domain-containing protein n=1 Tax=Erythranthe guttata TaxID=4155 RepID=A0A022RUJ0_ERYGU|nr:hypothetical protein MIMGU_mgv1a005514mg [Erythranthe guttata]
MDSGSKVVGGTTPVKERTARSKLNDSVRCSENLNPNVSSPGLKFSNSPSIIKSDKSARKSASGNPRPSQLILASPSPKKKIRERKFVIAKKKSRNAELNSSSAADAAAVCGKCAKATGKSSKCLCVAYESLRASQDDFFKNRGEAEDEMFDQLKVFDVVAEKEVAKPEIDKGLERKIKDESDETAVKRNRDILSEEARVTVPIRGPGKVMNLVKEFEKLSMLKLGNSEENEVEEVKQDLKASELEYSSSSFCPSDLFLTSESLGLDTRRSYSLDSSQGRLVTITSDSTESSGNRIKRHWQRKQPKATSQKPFMLKTEERGRSKEEEFMKKLQQMLEEEEKMRIPIAQGLPWTTDEPECLVKPQVKENTRPVDLVLYSDMRAVERSEFDHQVAMKMNLIKQYRMERERQQKLAEEEEIRRLRKVLVPKAQPLPYFDRPFVPKRSMKQPTVPKEPKFHIPQQKKIKCNLSLDDDLYYTQQQQQ